MGTVIQDLKYGLRQFRRNPGFTIVAVLTLALGIGATTAIFSVVNGVLLSPLPYPNPSRLVIIRESSSRFPAMAVSYPNFLDWQRQQRAFSALAIHGYHSFNLAERRGAEVVSAGMVSAGFFKILGITPIIGRSFLPQDDHLGAGRTVILSYHFWRQHFGGNRTIPGKSITLDDKNYAVIGVLPKTFWFFNPEDVYVPVGVYNRPWRTSRGEHPGFYLVGRLKPGVTSAQAQSDMNNIAHRLAAEYPRTDTGHGIVLTSMPHLVVRNVRTMLYLLLGTVCLVLLIACVNVANLLLSRSTAREKEVAIRTALGARRQRVIRQLLVESVLLAFLGGALGILLAGWGTHSLLAYVPQALPRAHNVGIDFAVLLFVVAVSVVTGILFGLAPAFHSSRVNLRDSLQQSSRGTKGGPHALQNGLVVAEVGLALVLLVGAGLTLRSMLRLYHVKTGFVTRGALVFGVSLPASHYNSGPADRAFYRQVTVRIRSLPGVRAVGATGLMPMSGNVRVQAFYVEGRSKPEPHMPEAMFYVTTPGFQRAMGIRLLRGRFFTDQDTLHSGPVVVIDDAMGRKLFHGQDPLGHHIIFPSKGFDAPREIVGVVHHIKQLGPAGRTKMKLAGAIYMPVAQVPDSRIKSFGTMDLTLVVRTSVSPQSMIPAVKRAVHSIDNGVALNDVHTISDLLRLSLVAQHLTALLLGIFSALALILAAVGIYGVVAYSVNQRTREIGIRMALGAQKSDVLKMVVGQGLKLALIGVGIGIAGALALTRFLSSLLYGVKPTDPLTFIAVSLILIAVALVACYIPARRAAKVDPMVALRYE